MPNQSDNRDPRPEAAAPFVDAAVQAKKTWRAPLVIISLASGGANKSPNTSDFVIGFPGASTVFGSS